MGINREKCVITQTGEDKFRLLSFEPMQEWNLDSIATWVWFLLDGKIGAEAVSKKISQQFPDVPKDEHTSILKNLFDQGLAFDSSHWKTSIAAQKKSLSQFEEHSRTLDNLNIYLQSFPDSLDTSTNYLVWMLWQISSTITITPTPEQAEIVFCYSSSKTQKLDLPEVDQDGLKILVSENEPNILAHTFDYIISTRPAPPDLDLHQKWLRLPSLRLVPAYFDPKLVENQLGSGYMAERLKSKFLEYLIGSSTEGTKQKSLDETTFLTIGMATFDDYDGVYFSLTSLLLHHPEVFKRSQIIILDNDPGGPAASHLKSLADRFENVQYETFKGITGTAVRDRLFSHAKGEWVLCMDSHVLFEPTVLTKLVQYMENNSESNDLLQGPLLDDNGVARGTHFDRIWSSGMYGAFGLDDRGKDKHAEPFEIEMQGLGVFACRNEIWPGFNKSFRGFGGEEGYIHQKFRNNNGRCLCLPFFRWAHRFGRPHGARYEVSWRDRIRNYMIGFEEVGLDTDEVKTYFSKLITKETTQQTLFALDKERKSPFASFDHIVCLNLDHDERKWKTMSERFERLGIENLVHRVSAIHTPEFHHIGCALSHRKAIEFAWQNSYENVLVFEDDALMLSGAGIFLGRAQKELVNIDWKILYLGGFDKYLEYDLMKGYDYVCEISPLRLTCTHALAYNKSVYTELLDVLPNNEQDMADWLVAHSAIDKYLGNIDSRYLVLPKLFSQSALLENEDSEYRHSYT